MLANREGLLLEWRLPGGARSWTEAAPLPGWSTETVEDCVQCLRRGEEFSPAAPASIRFASSEVAFGTEGDTELPYPVRGQALIPADQTMGPADAPAGFSTVKIKVGPDNFSQAIELAGEHGKTKKIRLDANGTVSFSVWKKAPVALLQRLDYIEDPCGVAELPDFLAWAAEKKIAVAKDATTPQEARDFWRQGGSVVVAKPMVWGGFREVEEALVAAAAVNGRLVVSSSLETSVGRTLLVRHLSALAWREASGVCTGFVFGGDALADKGVYSSSVRMSRESWWGELRWIERQ
ncbi:MAG: hypothetical protein HUU37_02390 [Bdellovibrionales bacterium]|nr:hypothetical protein [Bdellovibrionales bacterium]